MVLRQEIIFVLHVAYDEQIWILHIKYYRNIIEV